MIFHEDRAYESGFPVEATLFTNYNFLAHWHSEIEILLVLEGQLTVSINSDTRQLTAGDMAICTSGNIHYYDGMNGLSRVLIIVFQPELIENMISLPTNFHFISPFFGQAENGLAESKPDGIDEIRTIMNRLHMEMSHKEKYYKVLVKCMLTELISLMLRHLPLSNDDLDRQENSGGSRKLIQKAIKYIENNFAQPISLEDISRHLGISEVYFSRIFNKVSGLNFKTYLNTIRIEKADHMIRFSSDPVTEIAYECGFNSIRTFNRVYKAIKGITPTERR
jgi:AraC-like DNA-binding protein